MDYLLQLFKGMGNERRMSMVELLLDRGEMHIEDIAAILKIPLATCCRNLKILERVYVVNIRRKNGRVLYSLNNPSKHPYNSLIIALIKKYRKKKKLNSAFAKK
jgi:DNA-binding transcriptional ArsR family regulator